MNRRITPILGTIVALVPVGAASGQPYDVGAALVCQAESIDGERFGDTRYGSAFQLHDEPAASLMPAAIGACCLCDAVGTCLDSSLAGVDVDQEYCDNVLHGRTFHVGAACASGSLPQAPCVVIPTGACCNQVAETCTDNTKDCECAGTCQIFQGASTTCIADPCDDPIGACCSMFPAAGTCTDDVSKYDCQGEGEHWQGYKSKCTPVNPCSGRPLGTAFTFQAQLKKLGTAVTGTCDLKFYLYDVETLGTPIAGPATYEQVIVEAGLFTVDVDFGVDAQGRSPLYGGASWLEVEVCCPQAGVPEHCANPPTHWDTLNRVKIMPTAYALALDGLWTMQTQSSPNLIGGYHGNEAAAGIVGATISGGGYVGAINKVSSSYATVGGGEDNKALASHATVAGGEENTASGIDSTIGGGQGNKAVSNDSTVAGGTLNEVYGELGTIGGGKSNKVGAQGDYPIVAMRATVGGGVSNEAKAAFATIAGGSSNFVYDNLGTIGGGHDNIAGDDDLSHDPYSAPYATIGGGNSNEARTYATVGGGKDNEAHGSHSTVGGGAFNKAMADYATIGGGDDNWIWNEGHYCTVAGGLSNLAGWTYGSAKCATVGGGELNMALADYAIVPGGLYNRAVAPFSFAAGRRANATHDGAFLWADSNDCDFNSTAANEFAARATGGVRFVTAITECVPTTTVYLEPGGTSWDWTSDRAIKENFASVDQQAILEKVAALPVQEYNLKSQDPSIRHIGPVAQDFATFGYGVDEKSINSQDASGVALAAIQGLYEIVQEKECEIEELRAEKDAQISDLETRLTALEKLMKQADADGKGGAR